MDLNYFKLIKEVIKRLFIKIGFIIGDIIYYFFENNSKIFFFFPVYHIGGAEKVHLKITGCFKEEKPLIFFTERTCNNKLKRFFKLNGFVLNIYYFYRVSWIIRLLLIGAISEYINKYERPVVFGANSSFFYLLIPYLKPEVKIIDMIHAFGGGFEITSLPHISKIDKRIVIAKNTLEEFNKLYLKNDIYIKYLKRITVIENKISVPKEYTEKNSKNLTISFIGRDSAEKRLFLVLEAFHKCIKEEHKLEFIIIGDVSKKLRKKYTGEFIFLEEIIDEQLLNEYYKKINIIVLASEREGFPLVVMEAMAYGVVPIVTNVGGLPYHIENNVNGILISDKEEKKIIGQITNHIHRLDKDRMTLHEMSLNARDYAVRKFKDNNYCENYTAIIKEKRNE